MNKTSKYIKEWRNNTKQRIVTVMGGKCQCCGYNKCNAALECHHLNPTEKDFSFGKITANPRAWNKILSELEKCILVCANCHREIHNNSREVPENFAKPNSSLVPEYKTKSCVVCGKETNIVNKTCSNKCAAKLIGSIPWNEIDLESELYKFSAYEIAEKLGCSYEAIIKRCKKININYTEINKIRKVNKLSIDRPERRVFDRPSEEEMQKLLWEKPITHIAKQFGVSETCVRKWIKKMNVKKPESNYWKKIINSKSVEEKI